MSRIRATFLCTLLFIPVAGCPKPPDDVFEPNDTFEQATQLALETEFNARVVQDNPDVLSLTLDESGDNNRQIEFDLVTVSGEECPAFIVTAPNGSTLYQDTNHFCSRAFATPISAAGAVLTQPGDGTFSLRVPALTAGTYFLTIEEKGQVDNVFDYVWFYQVTAHVVQ
jgi:hypothetical protein